MNDMPNHLSPQGHGRQTPPPLERRGEADALFSRIHQMLTSPALTPAVQNKIMHETLVLACAEGLKNSKYGFGDLNSQVETLVRMLHIPTAEAIAIRQMRRHSNRTTPLLPEDLRYDAFALAGLVSRIYHAGIPEKLISLLPHNPQTRKETLRSNRPDKRCIVLSWDADTIRVIVDEEGEESTKTVRYNEETQYARMGYLNDILKEGMHLNLLGCSVEGETITPRLIVVEPDCLLDISAIASCFEDYGHHPLSYIVSRMKPKANTQAILTGNFAGSALDDIINNPKFDARQTLINNFKERAMEYSTCPDFNPVTFKQEADRQVANLLQVVDELRQHFDLSKAILEPSFICEKLGIQGRVDLMTTDLRLLVEQKSGRNILLERNRSNRHGAKVMEKHYVQVLLYYGILYYNFHLSKTDIRLLYSKYPLPGGMMGVANLMQLVYEAIRFRNEAVALEFDIAHNGFAHLLPKLTEETLNTERMNDFFYNNYLRPPLVSLLDPLASMQPLERAYFCRMMQFVVRENLMSKVGVVEGQGNSVANLWNMPLTEKKETGNIYTNLTIINKEKNSGEDGTNRYDLITLAIPDQGQGFLPNFRRGDMVLLYAYPADQEPDVRKALLFKGGLADIRSDRVTVKLADGQQNPDIFNHLPYDTILSPTENSQRRRAPFVWCIEHAGSDVGSSAAVQALYELVTSTSDRKALLLGQRMPENDRNRTLSHSYTPALDDILLKAKQAKDFFLLVGPPGTGKTSMALQYMVRECLADPTTSLLLLSYTNRAVDEICGMLVEAGIDFIRLGNELSCTKAFEPYLISHVMGERPSLDTMRQKLLTTQVIVSTTSTLQQRPYIFSLKHFDLAIVDESSQILEPNIIGLLASHRTTGNPQAEQTCNIDKFILIGDYKQLPAVVQQHDADAIVTEPELQAIGLTNCKNSLFERLIRQELSHGRTDFIGTLYRQGRMHPDIADFPNKQFYFAENLVPVPLRHQLEEQPDYPASSQDRIDDLLKQHRLLFFASQDCRQPDISDKVNTDEACIVANLLQRIHRFYGYRFKTDKTVGVIVPYRNQIAMIRREIEKTGIAELQDISIDTVERYQGSQRDVIIYSFTIQHAYQLGFLTANSFEEYGRVIDRKLNVALTRARKQLILTGNPDTLAANPLFSQLIDHCKAKNGYIPHFFGNNCQKV